MTAELKDRWAKVAGREGVMVHKRTSVSDAVLSLSSEVLCHVSLSNSEPGGVQLHCAEVSSSFKSRFYTSQECITK